MIPTPMLRVALAPELTPFTDGPTVELVLRTTARAAQPFEDAIARGLRRAGWLEVEPVPLHRRGFTTYAARARCPCGDGINTFAFSVDPVFPYPSGDAALCDYLEHWAYREATEHLDQDRTQGRLPAHGGAE